MELSVAQAFATSELNGEREMQEEVIWGNFCWGF